MDIDIAYKHFQDYLEHLDSYLAEPLSESDTRAKFIDVFVRDILGWPEGNIRREPTHKSDEGHAAIDYVLSITRDVLVIEAKKLPILFELPDERGRCIYSLDGVIKSCPNLWSAVTQARRYCDDRGIEFALVTNGKGFGLFRAVTSAGSPWKTGKIALFDLPSLDKKHFVDLFNAISFGMITPASINALLVDDAAQPEWHRISDLAKISAGRLTNSMNDVMHRTFRNILLDQDKPSDDFLQECYCLDDSTEYYSKNLESLLKDTNPVFIKQAQKIRPGRRKNQFELSMRAMLGRDDVHPPICVIGGAGAGKTTFLNWFFRVSNFEKLTNKDIVLWMDFKNVQIPVSEQPQYILQGLIEQLEGPGGLNLDSFRKLKEVFSHDLKREDQLSLLPSQDDENAHRQAQRNLITEWRKDVTRYSAKLLEYATRHCSRTVVIVLDNIDQKNDEHQLSAYETANHLSSIAPTTTILSLREDTYYRHRHSPTINAFSQHQVFHLRSPRLHAVVTNRFRYLESTLKVQDTKLQTAAGLVLNIKDIGRFLRLLQHSLLEGRGAVDILKMIECVSNGNIRQALNMIYCFLTSGHTDIDKYFWKYVARKTKAGIPLHEFLASVMLNDMAFFTENNSEYLLDIYSLRPGVFDSHFTRLRILELVERLSPSNSFRPDDYVSRETLCRPFLNAGFSQDTLTSHIKSLVRFGLLQTETSSVDDRELFEDTGVHITASGMYYKTVMASSFTYLARVITDVPILDNDTYEKLVLIYKRHRHSNLQLPVFDAIEAVEVFAEYLNKREQEEMLSPALSTNQQLSGITFMPRIIPVLKNTIREIYTATSRPREHNSPR